MHSHEAWFSTHQLADELIIRGRARCLVEEGVGVTLLDLNHHHLYHNTENLQGCTWECWSGNQLREGHSRALFVRPEGGPRVIIMQTSELFRGTRKAAPAYGARKQEGGLEQKLCIEHAYAAGRSSLVSGTSIININL